MYRGAWLIGLAKRGRVKRVRDCIVRVWELWIFCRDGGDGGDVRIARLFGWQARFGEQDLEDCDWVVLRWVVGRASF